MRTGLIGCFFFSSRRRHTRCLSDWSSDVCSSDLADDSGGGGGSGRLGEPGLVLSAQDEGVRGRQVRGAADLARIAAPSSATAADAQALAGKGFPARRTCGGSEERGDLAGAVAAEGALNRTPRLPGGRRKDDRHMADDGRGDRRSRSGGHGSRGVQVVPATRRDDKQRRRNDALSLRPAIADSSRYRGNRGRAMGQGGGPLSESDGAGAGPAAPTGTAGGPALLRGNAAGARRTRRPGDGASAAERALRDLP